MNGLTSEEKRQALIYAINGADFMFEPSSELCNKILQGDEKAHGINSVMTAILLEKKPIRLDTDMIIKYCKGTLDKNNTWLFNNGNIRVVPPRFKQPIKLKPKEEDIRNKGENNGTKE
jgi:hypothetical protein